MEKFNWAENSALYQFQQGFGSYYLNISGARSESLIVRDHNIC